MRRNAVTRRAVVQAGTLASGIVLFPAISGAAAQDAVDITFWNSTLPVEDPNDLTKPLEDFYVYQAIERFQEANPTISVTLETYPGGPDLFTKYRTASVAQNGPDVMGTWSGTYMLQFQEFLEPVGSQFTDEERAQLTGWEAVNENFDPAAPPDILFGVPAGNDGVTVMFYNKALLEAAGINPEQQWVTNVDEFFQTLDAIAATDVTPLALDTNSIVWQVLLYWIGQTVGGSEGINQLTIGDRNFSDPELVEIVSNWQRLGEHTIPGAETMEGSETFQLFLEEQSAMMTGGFGTIDNAREVFGDNLGMARMPDYSADAPITGGGIGGPGVAFIVSNYSANIDAAYTLVKFLESPEELTLRAESGEGHLVNLVGVDATALYDDPFKVSQQEWSVEPSTIFWPDNIFPAELTTEIKAQSQLAWTGEISAEEFMGLVDAKRDELLGQ